LGSATVLCSDKTGTLTQNKMTVTKIFAQGKYFTVDYSKNSELPEDFHLLVEYGILASQRDPFDPMEKAITNLGEFKLSNTEHLHDDWVLVQQYPLSKELLSMSHVWRSPNGSDFFISAKGAPEAIFDLCHLPESRIKELSSEISKMADTGLRILGVAKSHFKDQNLPEGQHDFDFEFLGLIGLTDPVRPTVKDAVKECYRAGIKVVMITGDYSGTAINIAKQIGLKNADAVITGEEINKLTDDELKERVREVNIFARVVPEHKLRIVNAFKAAGEIVAMTGDGVNDAPALKSANIGIAMGGRGTDVAREASSLVLLDDDFSSIVSAVKMGRRIFDNLQKAMTYILSVHIPIAGMSLIPIVFGNMPIVFWPVHIVFMELIIDPACSVVFEAEKAEKNVMDRPPRKLSDRLFGTRQIIVSVLQGLVVLLTIFCVYKIALFLGKSENEVRALTFTTLIFSNLCLILTNRYVDKTIFESIRIFNAALIGVVVGALSFLALVLYVPFFQKLFHFSTIHIDDLLICLGAGFLSIIWFEIFKVFNRKRVK